MKQQLIRLFTALTLAGVILASPSIARAELVKADTPWSRPTFVYGAGLTPQEIDKTAEHLGVLGKDTLKMNIDGKDIQRYIGETSSDKGMISSALVTKLAEGDGVVVEIKTPQNITEITQVQYSNAAITAGVKDIRIDVAAVRPVTGSSALTGVYKAMEANGVALDGDRMVVAQDELNTVNEISKANEGKANYEQKNFDTLIINIKNELNIFYSSLPADKKITREDIQKIVEDAIAKNNLKGVLSQDNINQLVNLFEKYSKTDAINSKEVISQLKDLSGNILNRAKELYGEAQASGLWDRILKFFSDIIQAILNFFQGLGK